MIALKAVLYVLISVFGSSAVLFTADGWSGPERWNVLVLLIGAVGLWGKANTPTQPWAKFLIAVLAAGAAVLTSAWTDRMIEPVEWQQITLAILGAALVGAAGNAPVDGRHERVDAGRARLLVLLVVGFLPLAALLAVPASAHAPRRPAVVTIPHVVSVLDCEGTLWVGYGARTLDRSGVLTDVLDDGKTGGLELLDVSGRSQPHGVWLPVVAGRGGEGVLRVPDWTRQYPGAHFRLARVVRDDGAGVKSGPALITAGCPG